MHLVRNTPVQPQLQVQVNLQKIRDNISRIAQSSGVPVIAVLKADAYGCGAAEVIPAIDDLVDSYYLFEPREVIDAKLHQLTNRSFLAASCDDADAEVLRQHRIRPGVWTVDQARRWRDYDPVIAIDTGQQRFACPPEKINEVIQAAPIREAFTHASHVTQIEKFDALTRGMKLRRHAAGSSLLDVPAARFDAVRPGFAIYAGAVRVSTRLLDARDSAGPAGYSGFKSDRHGVIAGGYSDRMAAGVCMINGARRRVLEIGMQTAFVELGPNDRAGDEVVLLGDGLGEQDVAIAWRCGPHEALFRLASCGRHVYIQ